LWDGKELDTVLDGVSDLRDKFGVVEKLLEDFKSAWKG
jgi:hypothetical protein